MAWAEMKPEPLMEAAGLASRPMKSLAFWLLSLRASRSAQAL